MTERGLLTVKETAEYLGMSKYKIYDMIKTPEVNFPKIRIGRKYMIPRGELDQWITKSNGREYTVNVR